MPVDRRDVDKHHPLKGVQRRKELKRKRVYNRKHKTELNHKMDRIEKKDCYGKPKGCSREKRRWRFPRTGGFSQKLVNDIIASELLVIARLLVSSSSL